MHIELQIFGRKVELSTKALTLRPLSPSSGGWWPILRESFMGSWQRNVDLSPSTSLSYSAVYACVSLISQDISKLCLRLVEQDRDGIWTEAENPAFSPVLRKPNRYQTIVKFIEQWMVSKLTRGNAYVLKQRDARGVVNALYVLDPNRVVPLVTPDGAVYYEIRRDDLAEVKEEKIVVPAREVIHDVMCALFHPLIGVTPIYACGTAALQGLAIQHNSEKFFTVGANPSGILTAPGQISKDTADRLKSYFEANFSGDNVGRVAIAGDGLKYEQLTMSAVDAQLIEQLKWTAETVCTCFHVPPYMVGIGPPPPYANVEPLLQAYYSQCIQALLTALEQCLEDGLGLGKSNGNAFGVEFDVDDLVWMDTQTKTKAASDGIGGGGLSPNEARKKYYGLGPVKGGDQPYMQQQNFGLAALAERDSNDPFSKPTVAPTAPPAQQTDQQMAASFEAALFRKVYETEDRAA